MQNSATFGQQLTGRRNKLGLSQGAAARKAGVTRVTWRHWEQDKTVPHTFNYVRIEHAMEWEPGSVEAVLTGDQPTEKVVGVEVDRRRVPLDQTEKEMIDFGRGEGVAEDRIWWHIFNRRERNAKETIEGRRGDGDDSA